MFRIALNSCKFCKPLCKSEFLNSEFLMLVVFPISTFTQASSSRRAYLRIISSCCWRPQILGNHHSLQKSKMKLLTTATAAPDSEVSAKALTQTNLVDQVYKILEHREKHVSSSVLESKVKQFCCDYLAQDLGTKLNFLKKLSCDYGVNHSAVTNYIASTMKSSNNCVDSSAFENKLRLLLTPKYLFLFKSIGQFQNGVKFLVDLRADNLQLLKQLNALSPEIAKVKQLNLFLQNLFANWFSVGFLELERITWKSPCEMLQKISEYEAVHPMRSWADLKRRVGLYKRCFIYKHFVMPEEPLIVLHTALCKDIVSSTSQILNNSTQLELNKSPSAKLDSEENLTDITTAIFFSISATQPGLQGIELGNYLIKRVVRELQIELPQISKFSSLSPIPGFQSWLLDRLKIAETRGGLHIFSVEKIQPFLTENSKSFWSGLRHILITNSWFKEPALHEILKDPLTVLCAQYLYKEKKRGYALNSVANFHLRNGAVMWRINWLADVSPRGLSQSCGLMVNYRYFLDETEENSNNYLKNQTILASESVLRLVSHIESVSKL